MKNVSTEKIDIEGIPVLFLQEKNIKNSKGVLFLYHGWSSKKENYHFIGSIFALEGYQVIIPDSLNHGERGTLEYENENIVEKCFWQTATNSVDEYFKIKQYFQNQKLLLSKNIFLAGSSMGGMISSSIFVKDQDILSLIVMNGSCDWLDLDERIRKNKNIDRSKGIDEKVLNKYNPAAFLEKFSKRFVLLQHGENDKSVPIKTQEKFFEDIKKEYIGKEQALRFTKIPNLNHQKTTGMLEESVLWLNKICDEEKEKGS